jgi:hypothetical protein
LPGAPDDYEVKASVLANNPVRGCAALESGLIRCFTLASASVDGAKVSIPHFIPGNFEIEKQAQASKNSHQGEELVSLGSSPAQICAIDSIGRLGCLTSLGTQNESRELAASDLKQFAEIDSSVPKNNSEYWPNSTLTVSRNNACKLSSQNKLECSGDGYASDIPSSNSPQTNYLDGKGAIYSEQYLSGGINLYADFDPLHKVNQFSKIIFKSDSPLPSRKEFLDFYRLKMP